MANSTNNIDSNVAVDPEMAALREDISELTESVNAINEKLGVEEESEAQTNSKWTTEEIEEYAEKTTPLSSEAIDKAVSYGVPFSLFGFATVFAVLAVIMFIVIIFGKIFGVSQPKQKPAEAKPEPKKQQNSMSEETIPAPVAVAPAVDDKGIVAAIIAAISSFRSANGENGGFRVVSIKKRK